MLPLRVTVLISGGGTTLRNLLEHIRDRALPAEIVAVVSSNPNSVGLKLAAAQQIPAHCITTADADSVEEFSDRIFAVPRAVKTELVVCAGFLKRLRIPPDFVNRVVNIHPSLIPLFCGEGMYGGRVHEAVLAAGAKMSGCTVHFVDDHYDHGPIIAQRAAPVFAGDTPSSLAARVFAQECELYPQVIRWIAEGRVRVTEGIATVK